MNQGTNVTCSITFSNFVLKLSFSTIPSYVHRWRNNLITLLLFNVLLGTLDQKNQNIGNMCLFCILKSTFKIQIHSCVFISLEFGKNGSVKVVFQPFFVCLFHQVSHKPRSISHAEAASIPYVASTAMSALVNAGGLCKDRCDDKRQVSSGDVQL